jgi:hypothetical protein
VLNGVPPRLPPGDGMEAYDEIDSIEEVKSSHKGRPDTLIEE